MKKAILWVPLIVFVLFVATVASGLWKPSDRLIRSKMVGKPMPAFSLPAALPGRPGLASASLAAGRPRLVNIFASWCIPCIGEAPQLLQLKARGIPIDAVAVRDRGDDVARFLAKWGDPYQAIGSDTESQVQLALGSSGVPETFVVDGRGIIRYQHIGAIEPGDMQAILSAYEAAR